MPFPGAKPATAICTQCGNRCLVCIEGDAFFTPHCPRCNSRMDIKPLNNSLLEILIKRLPPAVRRQMNKRCW